MSAISVEVDTLTQLIDALGACKLLGLGDITLTTIAVEATPSIQRAHWRYTLEARAANPATVVTEQHRARFPKVAR